MEGAPKKSKSRGPDPPSLWLGVLRLVLGLSILGLSVYMLARGGNFARARPLGPPPRIVDMALVSGVRRDICGLPPADGQPVVIDMVYSNDKSAWIGEASNRFSRLCTNIQVRTWPMGDVESADAILDGEVKPTLWSPADDLVLQYLDHRWRERAGTPPFDISKQTSLAKSPLVVLIWEDRLRVVEAILARQPQEDGPWVDFMCSTLPKEPQGLEAMALEDKVPGTWIDWYNPVTQPAPTKKPPPAPRRARDAKIVSTIPTYSAPFPTLDQMKQWGRVKVSHTSPTRAASGLAALYLMAYDYVLPPAKRPAALREDIRALDALARKEGVVFRSERVADDFKRAFAERRGALGRWLARCEAGLESAPATTELLTNALFQGGPSRYDAVVTNEHLIFPVFARIDQFADVMAEVRVIYPEPTILNEHPVILFDGDSSVTEAQRRAAELWIAFLRSKELQELAITYGFRPSTPEMVIRDLDGEQNPFLRFRRYGVEAELPIIEPPRLDGRIVNELIRIWKDSTGRN